MLHNKRGILFVLSFFLIVAISPLIIASHNHASYEYLIGTQFLEEFGTVIAKTNNGDMIEIKGGGNFTLNKRSVNGGGEIIHRDDHGNIIGKGKWKAVKLISFKSYGPGTPQGLPENYYGGRALIKIIIDPEDTGESFEGILTVTCTIGNMIPKKAEEGIRLAVRDVPINFRKEMGGGTLFIRKD